MLVQAATCYSVGELLVKAVLETYGCMALRCISSWGHQGPTLCNSTNQRYIAWLKTLEIFSSLILLLVQLCIE